jgi:hypothetical protein
VSRMIPNTVHPDIKSSAEKKIFRLFRDAENTDDLVVLHSMGLARHQEKRRGEIDFLILCNRGIFILEVKGGRIVREAGIWKTIDRYGDVNVLHESPYEQASSAMFALEKYIRAKFSDDPRLSKLIYGYGVVFPNTSEVDLPFGTEGDRAITYTLEDSRLPISRYIGKMASFIESQTRGKKYKPGPKDIEKVLEYLRGDFECIPPLWIKAEETSEELLELTKEQYAVLDVSARKDRIICRGAAGTGKTILACREAINSAREGRQVLFLCYNRNLADALAYSLSKEKGLDNLRIDSIYRFMNWLISNSPFQEEFLEKKAACETDELYSTLYPYYATLAGMEMDPFDQLVIDEGQDFMTNEVLDFLDTCVNGGLESGKWRWFMDDNNQAGIYGHYNQESIDRLECFGTGQLLTINCRNTKQIHDETLMLVNPEVGAVAKVNGLPVRYAWFKGIKGQINALERQIKRFRDEGIPSSDIIILSARSGEQCAASKIDEKYVKPFDSSEYSDKNNNRISYSTVSGYKGLEASIVILTDIEEIEGDWWSSVLYVGMSRAKIELVVILPEKLKALYESRVKDAMSRLDEN